MVAAGEARGGLQTNTGSEGTMAAGDGKAPDVGPDLGGPEHESQMQNGAAKGGVNAAR
jgi:hypothetical protein